MHLYVNITVVQNVPSVISAYNCTQAWLNHKLISMLISLDIAQYSPICNLLHKFYFSSSLPDILRRGECRSISTSYCLGVMAFYPLVTDQDNNSDIYLSGWTLVCTRHIQLSCLFPQLLYYSSLEPCIDHELLAHDLGFNCQGESSKGSQIVPIINSVNHRRH